MPEPRFTWDASSRRFKDSRGRFVPAREIRAALDEAVGKAAEVLRSAAEDLRAGRIDLGQFQDVAEARIKAIHLFSAALAAGGWASAGAADWSIVGNRLKREYAYLRDFLREIATGSQPLDGTLASRAVLYGHAGVATFEAVRRAREVKAGVSEEKRVLHSGESCTSCRHYASLGWRPIGSLPGIGEQCECKSRCKCTFLYRGRAPLAMPSIIPVTSFAGPEVDFDIPGTVAGPEFILAAAPPSPGGWWSRLVAFATKGKLKRSAHAGLNAGCGTGAGGFKKGNTCGRRAGAHGTGKGGTQKHRKALAAKIRALRGQAKTPEQKKALLDAIRVLKAHERGDAGASAEAAKIRRAIHAGKAPKAGATAKSKPTPKPKQPSAREKIKAAVAAKRAARGLSDAARKNKAEGLRRERGRKAEVEAKADRARKIKEAVGKRREKRGLIPEQRKSEAARLRADRARPKADPNRAAARIGQSRARMDELQAQRGPAAAEAKRAQADHDRFKGSTSFTPERQAARDALFHADTKLRAIDRELARHRAYQAAAQGRPSMVPPGPIAERLADYHEGDAHLERVKAAAQPHMDAAERVGREMEAGVRGRTQALDAAERIRSQINGLGPRVPKAKRAALEAQSREADAKYRTLFDERDALRAERDSHLARAREAVADALKVDRPATVAWEHRDIPDGDDGPLVKLSGPVKDRADAAAAWVSKVTRVGDDGRDLEAAIGMREKQRAYHSGARRDGHHIAVAPGTDTGTIVHELGHHMDDVLGQGGQRVVERSREFLDHRVGSEPLVKLNEVAGAGNGYRDDERGRKDKFDAAFDEHGAYYVGKDYGGSATEVMSMGLQKLYNDPVGFVNKDPEYAKYVIGVLQGDLR